MRDQSKKAVLIAILSLVAYNIYAQVDENALGYYNDALRFTQTTLGGTARIQALGGAQIALGSDISSVFANPAGLGMYTKSEFSITPSLNFLNTSSHYLGNTKEDGKVNFNFNNLGFVYNMSKDNIEEGKWRGGSFGFSVNKVNNFHNRFSYQAQNDSSSIIDYIFTIADGTPPGELKGLAKLAYQTYLINPIPNTNEYDSYVETFPVQDELVQERMGQHQLSISYGGNYDDKIYFGAGLGLMRVLYNNNKSYIEFFEEDEVIQDLELKERLNIDGFGINGTFGVIVRPIPILRLGLTATTPTYYWMNEEYTSFMQVNYYDFNHMEYVEDTVIAINLGEEPREYSETSIYEYNLTTPFRLNAGAALFIGQKGFISADVEWVNYAGAKLKANDSQFESDNTTIHNIYKSAFNYRVGGEFRYKILRLRGGFSYMSDPYKATADATDLDRGRLSYSGGFGLHFGFIYADVGLVHTRYKSYYIPYPYENITAVETLNKRTNVMMTVGFYF